MNFPTRRLILMAALSLAAAGAEVVRYADFGAVGDGKTDDFDALIAAHRHANAKGLPVQADDGATYYLGKAAKTIPIQTSTDFGKARFLIDDTDPEDRGRQVFEVTSALAPVQVQGLGALRRGQERLDAGLSVPCLVRVTDDSVKRFIRQGKNQNAGKSQTDCFLIDPLGNIDRRTPILWDFDRVSSVKAHPVDAETLFLRGGIFTTKAHAGKSTDYVARGIGIKRSRVVVEGLTHLVVGEGKDGPPYGGFLHISNCAYVMVRDTVLTGHRTYFKAAKTSGQVPMGSYDISIHGAVNVTLLRVTQSNDIMDRKYWGIIGTNFCKNLVFDGCKLSRFDAHMGVTNAAIRSCTLGHMGILLTGFGDFLIENSTVHGRNLITLRPDYGSTWTGSVTIRDCTFVPTAPNPAILSGTNDGQHDFGYPCTMPETLVIEGLTVRDGKLGLSHKAVFLLGDPNPKKRDGHFKEPHPYQVTRRVVKRKVTTESGMPVLRSLNAFLFREVEVRE